jgi:hypothetical protein
MAYVDLEGVYFLALDGPEKRTLNAGPLARVFEVRAQDAAGGGIREHEGAGLVDHHDAIGHAVENGLERVGLSGCTRSEKELNGSVHDHEPRLRLPDCSIG